MRLREFNLTEDELFELKMSPGRLAQMVKNIDARAGMEFELIVPNVENSYDDEDDFESEPDYGADESFPTGRGWQREVINFFRGENGSNSTRSIQNALEDLDGNFWEWMDDAEQEFIDSQEGQDRVTEIAGDNVDRSDYETDEEYIAALQNWIDENQQQIRNEISQEFRDDADTYFERWLDEQGIGMMSDFGSEYGLDWPYWTEPEYSGSRDNSASIDQIADDFSRATGYLVNSNTRYHGNYSDSKERWNDLLKNSPGRYVIEPDGSLDAEDGEIGLEFVSPPMPVNEMLNDIDAVTKWARRVGAYTNDSTGLHMNVSVPDQRNLDYVKLAMFLGDNYILEQFGREGNSYCRSALKQIQQQARENPDRVEEMLRQFQNGLNQLASKLVHTGSTQKFTSINNRGDWIEFRSPGGDWLREDLSPVKNTLLRTVVALDIATKPEAFKQEYYKKLVKTLQNPVEFTGARGERQQRVDKGTNDAIQYFAQYAAGELPRSALMSFIKQLQTKRQAGKKQPDSGADAPPNESIYQIVDSRNGEILYPGRQMSWNYSVVMADNVARARTVPRDNIRIVDLANNTTYSMGGRMINGPRATIGDPVPAGGVGGSHPEGRGRPHDPNGRYAIVSREDPAAYQTGRGTEPEYLFRFNMSNPAEQHNGRYILAAWAARNSVDPANYMVVDAERWNAPADVPTAGGEQARQRAEQQDYRVTYTVDNGTETSIHSLRISAANANAAMDRVRTNVESHTGNRVESIEAEPIAPPAWRDQLRNHVANAQSQGQGSQSLPPGNARWRILDRNDQEVYSFVNTTAQIDANRYAHQWLISNGDPARAPFMVVPVT